MKKAPCIDPRDFIWLIRLIWSYPLLFRPVRNSRCFRAVLPRKP